MKSAMKSPGNSICFKETLTLTHVKRTNIFLILLFCVSGSLSSSAKRIPQKGEMPILAWYSIPDSACTTARYQELRDAGFTATFPHLKTMAEVDRALVQCKKTGLKLLATCSEIMDQPETAINHLKSHPNLLAYFLRDEPSCSQFAEFGAMVRKIQALDPAHSCYINLLPECGGNGAPYPEYVKRGVKELGTKIVSFDIYPIHYGGIAPTWYWQLETISSAAREAGLPFWAFALLCTHGDYPTPTIASLRLQLYSDLAYGAQCLQYFTYWTPIDAFFNFRLAPIDVHGKRTPIYNLVRQMNKEIQQVAGVFIGAEVQDVCHTGNNIPERVKHLTDEDMPHLFTTINTNGAHALVSRLHNGKNSYVVIQNCELEKDMTLSVETRGKVKRVLKNGTIASLPQNNFTTDVAPGDIRIYTY